MTKISCYHGACLGWGFQADLASSQGSVWWAAREPGARHLGPRRVELCLGVGGGGGVALQSRAPPALPRSPPLLTTLYTDVRARAPLNDFTFTFPFPALEKEMATHSSVLAWRIPGTGTKGTKIEKCKSREHVAEALKNK